MSKSKAAFLAVASSLPYPETRSKGGLPGRLLSDRILPIDLDVILVWGQMIGRLELIGKKMAAMDSLIAAIALSGNLRLVTRNEDDFKDAGIQIVNPWKD